jgi:hypothetical protein
VFKLVRRARYTRLCAFDVATRLVELELGPPVGNLAALPAPATIRVPWKDLSLPAHEDCSVRFLAFSLITLRTLCRMSILPRSKRRFNERFSRWMLLNQRTMDFILSARPNTALLAPSTL